MTTTFATSIQEIRTTAVMGSPRGTAEVVVSRGVDALADVCRGLFGGLARSHRRRSGRMLDETVEIVISRADGSLLASAA